MSSEPPPPCSQSQISGRAKALEWLHAALRANLEEGIAAVSVFNGYLPFHLRGDFEPPDQPITVAALGITIESQPLDASKYGKHPSETILRANARLKDATADGINDAVARINTLVGALTLLTWGDASIDPSIWLLRHRRLGKSIKKLSPTYLDSIAVAFVKYPPEVRARLQSALYWIRAPQEPFYNPRCDLNTLRVYAGYWNAFECLIESLCLLKPPPRSTASEKQRLINEFMAARSSDLTVADIDQLYKNIVNPGFVGKAKHALRVCFGEQADAYVQACFTAKPQHDRLYDIRNAINHGDIRADDRYELLRVEIRLQELRVLVWSMFSQLLRFPSFPTDHQVDCPGELASPGQ